jgi:opacity protein-like surface antigen
MTPAWLLDIVAALMLVVAAVSAARLLVARPWQHGAVVIDTDVAHLLMALAMAGMLAAGLAALPAAAWEVVFGLLTVWFAVRVLVDARANGVRALAGGHCAPHLVHSAAMLYMFLALTAAAEPGGTSSMGAMPAGSAAAMSLRVPTLAFVFALILVGYSIWDLDQLSGRRYALGTARISLAGVGAPGVQVAAEAGPAGGAGTGGFLLSPAATVGARITMGAAMVFMLVIAI